MTINRKMKKSEFFSVHSLFAGLCGALALIFAFASCDVGLGESIDTSVPTVSITQPASSSSVSGDFVIGGVANDDKSLDKVVLTIKNTATGETTTQTTNISGKNWSIVLDKLNFKDGTYSVDVVAYDGAGRVSGTASRVFDVDNTPPVFCVTKPNSISIDDPAAYGRDVTIKGEIADDHAVKQMDIRVFKKDASGVYSEITNSLAKTTFEGFETAGGTEVTIAKYFPDTDIPSAASEDYVLYQNYMKMYEGATVGDTVSLYIFPYLTDAAGNVSDKCYIQSSLKQLIAEACGISVISDSLQTAQLKKILNGSYNLSELDDDDIETVKKILDGTYDQSGLSKNYKYFASLPEESSEIGSSSPLAMSVNANNSPMYEFGGYVFDKDDPKFAEVSSGGNASIKVTAGLDGNEVKANTIRAYFYLCDDTGDREEVEPSYSSDNTDPAKRFDIKDGDTLVQNLPDSKTVANATYNITLPNSMAAGLHYLMVATGEDTAGNRLYSAATYAFMVSVTGDAPKVEFDDQFFINAAAVDKTKSAAYSATINIADKSGADQKGTIKEHGNWVKVTPILYKGYAKTKGYLKDEDILETLTVIKYEESGITKVADGAYKIEVPMNKFDLTGDKLFDNYTVALKVQAKSQGATSEETTYIFWADKAAPALSISAPVRAEGQSESDPIYIFENDKNITATTTAGVTSYSYKMSGTWSDLNGSGTSEIWYRWDDAVATLPAPSVTWTAATGTAVADKTYYKKQGQGLYLAETAIAMGASVSGMYTASISGWTAIPAAPKSVSRANWNQSVPQTNSSGKKLSVVAIDQAGNLSAVATVSNITFDFAPPAITIPTIAEYYKKSDATSGKYQFTVGIADASGIKSLDVKAYINGGTTPVNAATNPYGYSIAISADKTSATITLLDTGVSDGKWRFEAIASDTADRSSQKEFAFTVDTVVPERVEHQSGRWITIGESGAEADWFNSENLTIKGRFKEMTSGLDKVDYTLIPAGETTGVPGTEVIGGTVGADIAYAISPVGFKEGINTVSIIASDLAGNLSSQSDYAIQVDTTAPSVETAWYTYDGQNFTAATGNVMANGTNAGAKAMTVYGTVSENLSGLKDLALTINGTAVSSSVQYTKDDLTAGTADVYKAAAWANYAAADNKAYTGFKATIPASTFKTLPSGSVDLYALAHDIATNETKQRKFGISLDNDAPEITIMSPQADSSVNGTVAFSGIVDDNALSEVKGYWSLNGDASIDESGTPPRDHDAGLTGTSNWSLPLATSSVDATSKKITFVDGTEYSGATKDFYLKIYASDKAANSTVKVQKYTIDPQKDRPVITMTTAKLSGMEDGKPVWFESTKIEGTIEDDDGVDEFSYSIDAGANWNPITVTGGSWIADLQNDAEYTILFKVKDKAGTEFVSVKSDGADKYLAPVLVGTDSRFDGGDTRLYLKVDTKRPEFENLVYKVSDAAAGTYDWADSSDHKKLGTVGGQRKFIQLEFDAKDANGIASVTAAINGVSYAGTVGALTSGVYPCVITGIDVSALDSEAYSLSLEIKGTFESDVTTEPLPVIVDNTAPAVTKISPDLNTVHGNITVYGTVDYAKEIKYALGLSADKANKPADADYADIAGAGLTWFLYFDGQVSTASESHNKTFERYIIDEEVEAECSDHVTRKATYDSINKDKTFDAIVPIYVWIKATDDVGNVYEEPQLVNFDPQGGRPSFTYSNPEKDQARIGGSVKLYGGVDDDEGVVAAFLQIISKDHTLSGYTGGTDWGTVEYNADGSVKTFTLKANDLDYLKAAGYNVYKRKDYDPANKIEWNGSGDPNDYGVLLDVKGTAWSLTINNNEEFNPSSAEGESKTNALAVCGYAYDGGKFNLPQYRTMVVDADSPRISGQYLKQYESGASQAKASREYSEGIYVSGKWTLEFDLTDGDIIKKIYVGQSDSKADDAKNAAEAARESDTSGPDVLVKPSWCYVKTGASGSGYHAKLDDMTPDSGVGSKYLYVLFADEKGNYSNFAFAVHYDNVNPAIDASKLDIDKDIHNSNGYYSIGASVAENTYGNKNQSGFDKFVVYFKRGSKIYDPMVSKKIGGAENPDNWANVSSLTPAADGLYWFDQELEERDSANLNILKLKAKNGHIHAGGLVKIGGAVYVIKSLSSDGLSVTLDNQIELAYTTAQFAYGLVVDNTKNEIGSGIRNDEGYGYGYPASIMNSDSDCMVEYAHMQGTVCNLSAKINSRNIPDGKIDVHYTAYDRAGNYSKGSVAEAYVSNNAPRLANVIVKSDFNYDGAYDGAYETQQLYETSWSTWEEAEKEVFMGDFDDAGNPVRALVAAKGDVILVPEVMGGNGDIKWNCLYAGSSSASTDEKISTDTPAAENEDRTVNNIVLPATSLKTATAGLGKYVINILDSTEGGAQKAVINLCMNNDVNDSVKPIGKTKRFYWKSLANNSVYTTKTGGAESLDDLQGHIELGDQPKVSGKVVFKGTAYDNAGIAKISLTVPGFGLTAATAATCDFTKPLATRWTQTTLGDLATNGYHFALDADDSGNVKERYNNAGHFVSWTLELDTEKYNGGTAPAKNGVEFVLSVTDKNAKASDKTSGATTVYATTRQAEKGKYYAEARFAKDDKTSPYNDANYSSDEFSVIGAAQASEESGVYKYSVTPVAANYTMDIVPYITRVKTSLSAVNAKNGVTDRSSLGAYPVYVYKNSTLTGITDSVTKKNEDVEIYGFNLAGAKYGSTDLVRTAKEGAYGTGYVTLNSENIKQGAFKLTVGGIDTSNNTNNNDAHGSYTGTNIDDEGELIKKGGDYDVYKNYYNRQPNNANNNNLTDDIAFDVWQLNAYAAAPMYGNVENPQMKIQPFGKTVEKQAKSDSLDNFTPGGGGTVATDGKIGFAFANASSAFSMPNSDHSWTYWNYGYTNIRHTALAYGPDGYVWASAAGQDVNGDGLSDMFYLESTHWRESGGVGTSGNHLPRDTKIHSACKLEDLSIGTDKNNKKTYLDRIQSPSIAATTHGLYMAYFDKLQNTVRYRAGAMTGTYNDDWQTGVVTSSVWAPEGESKRTRYWQFKDGFFKNHATTELMTYDESLKYVQVVSTSASPNVCIAAIDGGATRANDVAVMVWCDGSKVSYAYTSGDPMADNGETGDAKRLAAAWTTVDDIFGGKVKGGDCKCQIAVDSAKGVHIAAYDEKNSDIWYAYLEDYNDPDNAKVCKVDSYNSTGEYLTIDVALDESNNPIPQIGYYSAGSSRPKFARWNAAKGSIKTLDADKMQGADEYNSYTGNWEVTNVPTQSAVRVSDEANKVKQNINVGVWKDADGKLAYSTKNGLATGAVGTSDCHVASGMNTTDNYGDVYGNGTRNAVLGYMWGDSADAFIETAQRMD